MNKKKKTFGSKLYSMFLISMLISAVIAMILFVIYSNRLAIEREEKSIQSILISVSQNLELQFNENENIKSAFYIYKKVFQETENLNNPKLYEYYDELTRIDLENNYTVTLTKTLHTSSKEVRAILFFPASGENTAYCLSKKSAEIQEISYPDYKEEVWYKEVTEKGIDTYYCTSDMPDYMPNKGLGEIYSYVTTLNNQDTHKIIGVLKIDVSKKKLQETLDTLQKSKDHALLLVQRGQVLAKSTGLGKVGKIEDHQVRVENRQYRTMKQTVPGTDLELIYLYSRLSIYKEFIKVTVLFFGIVMTGAVLAFFYYRFHAKRMVNDVEEISEILQCVERGELNKHIEVQGNSEFGMIAVAINQMIEHLKEYIDKEYILVIQQQKAEYRALQSQVNPHFLYNTLNGFVALNRMGEKKVLERSIIGLSRLFRYACGKQDVSCVREEINFLEEYLNLEKIKYEERLKFVIWVDEECKEKKIPKLLLQPIVENSIKHGMGNTDQPIRIRISAVYSNVKGIGNVMVLTVRDNGVGFEYRNTEVGEEHIGINNVRTRAELYCKNVIFQCVSEPGCGTKTTFVFPDED